MGRKYSDEECLTNYKRLRMFFDQMIEDAFRFTIVYGYGLDIGMMNYVMTQKTTYTYTSYIIGFDVNANEIVILPIDREIQNCGQPIYLKQSDIISAKQSWLNKEITIKDKRLPKTYIQFSVPEAFNQDDDEIIIVIKQNEQYRQFIDFFKKRYSKK